MTRPGKFPTAQAGVKSRIFHSHGGHLNRKANEAADSQEVKFMCGFSVPMPVCSSLLVVSDDKWLRQFCSLCCYPHLSQHRIFCQLCSLYHYRLVGLVVRRPPRERKVPGSNPACAGIFSGPSHTSDLKIGTPVATLPGAWRYRVTDGTGRPGVSILWLGEMESLICNFYFSVAARAIVWADPSLRYTRMLLGR